MNATGKPLICDYNKTAYPSIILYIVVWWMDYFRCGTDEIIPDSLHLKRSVESDVLVWPPVESEHVKHRLLANSLQLYSNSSTAYDQMKSEDMWEEKTKTKPKKERH